jgi:hypothetical protein
MNTPEPFCGWWRSRPGWPWRRLVSAASAELAWVRLLDYIDKNRLRGGDSFVGAASTSPPTSRPTRVR